ncbi:MAG: MBL fold metallo-hydrolase [Desulfobacterales bacterium]|jgi:glyoxylase-like metal-dependent hydrolase (beta-lactamase superfamily II)
MTKPPAATAILPRFFFFQRGFLNANHFAYLCQHPVLIDTGYLADWDVTEALLAGVGLNIDQTARIINTHSHCDHVGGNRRIQDRSGCEIAMHPQGVVFSQQKDRRSTWWTYYHQEAELFQATRSLEDGEMIRVGPYPFEVIHTPGHAADGLVLYQHQEKMLLSSDALWERDFPVMTLPVEGDDAVDTMLASLDKIAGLPVKRVYPGHGPPFTDYQGALKRALARLEGFQKNPELVGWDVVKKIIIYTIMMKRRMAIDTFFDHLMNTAWYPETVGRYFDGESRSVYDQVISEFETRNIIKRDGPDWVTTVRP